MSVPLRAGLPWAGRGQAVGLLGGSFDPPHEGHLRISEEALRRLRLDWLWWLVSPGNPLKARGPASLPRRVAAARALVGNSRIKVTDLEARLGMRFTAETLRRLLRRHPGVRFVWVMGSDNLAELHRWRDWRWIMEAVPVCVVARPGARLSSRFAPAARRFRARQRNERDARGLPRARPPAWVVLNPLVREIVCGIVPLLGTLCVRVAVNLLLRNVALGPNDFDRVGPFLHDKPVENGPKIPVGSNVPWFAWPIVGLGNDALSVFDKRLAIRCEMHRAGSGGGSDTTK